MRLDLPAATRNPISLIGAAITTAMAIVFLVLLVLEMAGQLRNPYLGLLLFVAVPAVFIIGLVLIPLGAWRQRRRVAAGHAEADWPVIDLRLPRTRSVVFAMAVLTCVNILIVSLAAYGTVHHMETAEFCGTTCHTTMEPEWKAYQVSAHAKVACVSCHVGPGAEALVQSKIAGTRQLWQLATNNVPTPVPAPVHTMRPARDTCQNCHWAEKAHGEKLKSIREYADDEASSETVTALQLHVGNGSGQRAAPASTGTPTSRTRSSSSPPMTGGRPFRGSSSPIGTARSRSTPSTASRRNSSPPASGERWTASTATIARRTRSTRRRNGRWMRRSRPACCRARCRSRGAKRWRP